MDEDRKWHIGPLNEQGRTEWLKPGSSVLHGTREEAARAFYNLYSLGREVDTQAVPDLVRIVLYTSIARWIFKNCPLSHRSVLKEELNVSDLMGKQDGSFEIQLPSLAGLAVSLPVFENDVPRIRLSLGDGIWSADMASGTVITREKFIPERLAQSMS